MSASQYLLKAKIELQKQMMEMEEARNSLIRKLILERRAKK